MPSRFDQFRTHRQSRRLRDHDYSAAGWYFVTICTARREPTFGDIRRGVMGLSAAGCIAHRCWEAIPRHASRAHLDAFVVMPNHVHGLIALAPDPDAGAPSHAPRRVAPLHATALPDAPSVDDHMSDLSPEAGSLSAIVRSYKSAVTREARQTDPAFAWQPRFHDHVVRSKRALHRIRWYIRHNPATWATDRLHPEASGGG